VLLAWFSGVSVVDVVAHVSDGGPPKRKIAIRKLAERDSRAVTFTVADDRGSEGVTQRANMHSGARRV